MKIKDQTRTAYMDITDFLFEVGEGNAPKTDIFSDPSQMNEGCHKDWGIVKVEIRILEVIQKPEDKNLIHGFEDLK